MVQLKHPDYAAINLANWEARVEHHAVAYGLERYRSDAEAISGVVAFDRPRLGDIAGLNTVHLQCHIGTDTLSLHRLGAKVTGLDFSPSALAVAADLAASTGADIDWVCADVYDAVDALGGDRFDLVYTGVGAINWLPDIRRWAQVVAGLMRPGGRFFMREGHPVLYSLSDPRPDGVVAIEYPYFESGGTKFTSEETYVDQAGPLSSPDSIDFGHGLAEIFNALWEAGLTIDMFVEHDSVSWAALGDQMEEIGGGEYRLIDRPERLPHSYTISATRPA